MDNNYEIVDLASLKPSGESKDYEVVDLSKLKTKKKTYEDESTSEYLKRNLLAKQPANLISGLGGIPGNLQSALRIPPREEAEASARRVGQSKDLESAKEEMSKPENYHLYNPIKQILSSAGLGDIKLPTSQDIRESLGSLLGKVTTPENASYYTESRPGDAPGEIGGNALAMFASGGLNLPSALGTLGATGASLLGGKVGEVAGEQFDHPELGQLLGSLGGGAYGHKIGRTAGAYLKNYPTEAVPKLLEQDRVKAKQRIAEETQLKRENILKESGIKKQKIEKAQASIPKEVEGLKSSATKRYAEFDKVLEKLPGKDLQMNPSSLLKKLEKISEDFSAGAEDTDQNRIFKLSAGIDARIKEGKLSFKAARKIRENLGDIVHERTAPIAIKKAADEMRRALSDSMKEAVKPYPKVRAEWTKADRDYSKYMQLKKSAQERLKPLTEQTKQLQKTTTEALKDIKKEKLTPPIDVKQRTVFDALADRAKTGGILYYILGELGTGKGWKKALTLYGALEGEVRLQKSVLNDLKKNNKPLWEQYQSSVKEMAKGNAKQMIQLAPTIDAFIDKHREEEE